MPMKVVNIDTMRTIEKAADAAGHSYADMMELAGRATADYILNTLVSYTLEPNVLILVGPGNNGGDGLVAGRCLMEDLPDATVIACLVKARDDDVFKAARDVGVSMIVMPEEGNPTDLEEALMNTSVVVDALFGTGARLPIEGKAAEMLSLTHHTLQDRQDFALTLTPLTSPPQEIIDRPIIIAVDCPSGLDCDTGQLDEKTLYADATITFAAAKLGQLKFPGAEAVGDLIIGDIGLPADLEELDTVTLTVADGTYVKECLPKRSINTHKGSFGKVMVIAGSANYIGAAYLAGAAAYRVGAGLVSIGAPQIIVATLASLLPDATWLLLPHEMGVLHERAVPLIREASNGYDALLLGPGLGQDEVTKKFIEEMFKIEQTRPAKRKQVGFQFPDQEDMVEEEIVTVDLPPMVIDADGLNLLAHLDEWWKLLPSNTILTPHPAEFARLAGLKDDENQSAIQRVQADRVNLAIQYAAEWNVIVVLKGAFTIVAGPDGGATIIPFATSALATAGTGDVLAGAIVGLLGQGVTPLDAAVGGAWIHGLAGMLAENAYQTPRSVTANDVLSHIAQAISLVEPKA